MITCVCAHTARVLAREEVANAARRAVVPNLP